MKVFHCDHCDQPVFFENTACVSCGHLLAFLPDRADMTSLERAGDYWRSPHPEVAGRRYRLCRNYTASNICNWTIGEAEGTEELCAACRLTRIIPDLSIAGRHEMWYRLEVAKRRLIYGLNQLRLPLVSKAVDPQDGVTFEFLADSEGGDQTRVLTGHQDGVIQINVLEADDAEREKRRTSLGEPYRTLLGHFRHEIGHYYWNRLVSRTAHLSAFRTIFGDERQDYAQALHAHYGRGAPPDWQQRFVTAYSSAHPWEDWAETFAHYLHVVDTLETAAACGLSLRPTRPAEPSIASVPAPTAGSATTFDRLIESWFPVTYILNNLNRGMGLPDGYPFVLSNAAIAKLRFVHDIIAGTRDRA
jgi:hypothetical protein